MSTRTLFARATSALFAVALLGNAAAATTDLSDQPWRGLRIAVSALFLLALLVWLAFVVRDVVRRRQLRRTCSHP